MLAEAARAGAVFCLLGPKIDDPVSVITDGSAEARYDQSIKVAAFGAAGIWKRKVWNMKNLKIGRAMIAGLIGTVAMTALMVMAPMMGLPKMDIAAMLGSMLAGDQAAPGSFAWLAGLVMHLMIGTVALSTGYALTNRYLLTSTPLGKGLIYSALVWLMAQVVVMPMMGAGLFSSHLPQGVMMAGGSLMGHLVYGAVLGLIYGSQRPEQITGRFSTSHGTR
jgi:hypothetical protein